MYYGGGNETKVNNQSKPLPYPFVSLYLRGGTDGFALKGGSATSGTLTTMYDGPRPDCAIAGPCSSLEPILGRCRFVACLCIQMGRLSVGYRHVPSAWRSHVPAHEQEGRNHPRDGCSHRT